MKIILNAEQIKGAIRDITDRIVVDIPSNTDFVIKKKGYVRAVRP